MSEIASRRAFLGGAAALAAANTASGITTEDHNFGSIRLAVATYSLRKFSRSQAIEIMRGLGIKYANVKSFHMPYYLSKEDLRAARGEFEKAGIEIVAGGNVGLRKDDEDDVRYHLEYCKNAGIPVVVCAPTHKNLGYVEKHAKRLGLKIAIHNHGPEDNYFPAPSDVMKLIKNMDPVMGLCIDVGHTVRTGRDILEEIELSGDRVYDFHVKDLRDFSDKRSQVDVGEGKIPFAAIFKKLTAMNYAGVVGLEYEINASSPETGMAKSFSYLRGVLDGQDS